MASFYHAFFLPAFANGLFLAIVTKTGIDISPTGVGLMIFDGLQPLVNEQNVAIFRISELVLLIIPWIFYLAIVIKFGVKGLIIFGAITLGSYIFFLYFWI